MHRKAVPKYRPQSCRRHCASGVRRELLRLSLALVRVYEANMNLRVGAAATAVARTEITMLSFIVSFQGPGSVLSIRN